MLNNTGHFRIVARPKDVESRFPLLVVDGEGKPHLPLTRFYDHIVRGMSDGAARTYLNALLPYFRYLSTDEWRQRRGDQWNSPPEAVQQSVRDYLVDSLACKVRCRSTYEQVFLTARSPSTVHVFLCALKLFYQMMRRTQWYPYPHPLLDSVAHVLREIEQEQIQAEHQHARMPQESGVEEPRAPRSSENDFRVVEDEWVAQSIDNPNLHAQLVGGFKQAQTSLRDQIVIRIAYESGARIGEILPLTVGDWRQRGMKQEALACSKGSRGRRIKTIRFHMTTAKMLREYINTDRARLDQTYRRLDELSNTDPLFLSQRRKPYSYEAFKPHWYRLCTMLKIDLNIQWSAPLVHDPGTAPDC
jgi:integrase